MREAVMSATMPGVADGIATWAREQAATETKVVRPVTGWNPENFGREQIIGLVRQTFTSNSQRKRQIAFSAAEPETDIRGICMRVAEALAGETLEDVAIVGTFPEPVSDPGPYPAPDLAERNASTPLRLIARQLRRNLWAVPVPEGEARATALLHTYLGEVRREFEYSIVQAQSAGRSNDALSMAQCAEGVILVISAGRTRRAAANKIKQTFERAQVRLLGTVLSNREFPIPEGVYRRL